MAYRINSELTFREGAGAYPYKKIISLVYRKSGSFVKLLSVDRPH